MPTITVPIADAELARLNALAEPFSGVAGEYFGAKTAGLAKNFARQPNQDEIEAELRARLAAIPATEWDASDPELDELSGILPDDLPDDYREILLDKYR
jgi:hypothetical protein